MKAVKRRAIIVAGMHRSGTSATAGVLSLLGASLPRVLMPAIVGMNDVGFFEPSRIVEVHDELLASAGSSWHDTSPLPEAWFRGPAARAFGQRLKSVYLEEYGESELTVLKDPRVCRFLPLWQEILASLDVEPLFVIPFRHPVEVASSLARRDGFSSRKSAILWLQHVLMAEHASRGCTRGFVAYEELLADPRATLTRLGEQLSLDWAPIIERESVKVEEFLAKRHHHNRAFSPDAARPEELGELVMQTYSILEGVAGATSPDQERALDEIQGSYRRADELLGGLVRSSDNELHRISKELEAHKAEFAQFRIGQQGRDAQNAGQREKERQDSAAALAVEAGQVKSLSQELADRTQELAAAGEAIADRDHRLGQAGHYAESREKEFHAALASAASLTSRVQSLSETLAERDQEIGRRSSETAALQAQANDLEARARDLEARAKDLEARAVQGEGRGIEMETRAKDLEARLHACTTAVSHLRASTSWRITYPLRAVRRLFGQGNDED